MAQDPKRDLALLQLTTPVLDAELTGDRCPKSNRCETRASPNGHDGFGARFSARPGSQPPSGGLISNHGSPPAEIRWQTDTVINPGNSGGPVFENHGFLLGIAVGGAVKWTYGGKTHDVDGVNFFIPSSELSASPLFQFISAIPEEKRCWRIFQEALVVDASIAISMDVALDSGPSKSRPGPDKISRDYTVSETKDDHPVVLASHSKNYQSRFQAEPGYKIVACIPKAQSANHAHDITCNIEAGARSALFAYRLESGPAADRWRGWWTGFVTLQQERMAANGQQ